MGVFEWRRFAEGTKAVAEAVARSDAYSVVGGADSARALTELGLDDDVSWLSTGGGAALELLEGKELPGVAVIPEAARRPCGNVRQSRSKTGVSASSTAFPGPAGAQPQPSRMTRTTSAKRLLGKSP